jgi:hypothetical protein
MERDKTKEARIFLQHGTELVTIFLCLSKYNLHDFYNKQEMLKCKVNQSISLFVSEELD